MKQNDIKRLEQLKDVLYSDEYEILQKWYDPHPELQPEVKEDKEVPLTIADVYGKIKQRRVPKSSPPKRKLEEKPPKRSSGKKSRYTIEKILGPKTPNDVELLYKQYFYQILTWEKVPQSRPYLIQKMAQFTPFQNYSPSKAGNSYNSAVNTLLHLDLIVRKGNDIQLKPTKSDPCIIRPEDQDRLDEIERARKEIREAALNN